MAITRAQQFKQMLREGGRIGLKGGADAATESFSKSAGSSRKGRPDPKGGFDLSGGKGPTFDGAPASDPDKDTRDKEKAKYNRQYTVGVYRLALDVCSYVRNACTAYACCLFFNYVYVLICTICRWKFRSTRMQNQSFVHNTFNRLIRLAMESSGPDHLFLLLSPRIV